MLSTTLIAKAYIDINNCNIIQMEKICIQTEGNRLSNRRNTIEYI